MCRLFFTLSVRKPRRALAVAGWWLIGKRVRAKNRLREAVGTLPDAYRLWLPQRAFARADSLTEISLHLHVAAVGTASLALLTLKSTLVQSHRHWTLFLSGSAEALAALATESDNRIVVCCDMTFTMALCEAARTAGPGYIVPLEPGTRLDGRALAAFAAFIDALPDKQTPLLFADEDAYDESGTRYCPWLKPVYDAELFIAQDYVSGACAIPAPTLVTLLDDRPACGDDIQAIVATLLLKEPPLATAHVPDIVVSRPPDAWCSSSRLRHAVVRQLLHKSVDADVVPGGWGTLVVRHPLPDPPPLVSIIVPTRDALEILSVCIRGILDQTAYPAIEVIIADNASAEPATHSYFADVARDRRVRVVAWPHPYNFAAINNFAAHTARGGYLCFLNNDIEVIDTTWLTELMRFAVRPGVGAVGAQLRYPDGTIQHAGVTIGLGNAAGHAHRGLDPALPGYFARHAVAHRVSAVTAACLVVAREKFDAVGGFDAEGFAIAYNDVDLCLKLQHAGWRNCYVPQAYLIHHESKTRGSDFAPEHAARYQRELALLQQRWHTVGAIDPVHHHRLDRAAEVYRFDVAAR